MQLLAQSHFSSALNLHNSIFKVEIIEEILFEDRCKKIRMTYVQLELWGSCSSAADYHSCRAPSQSEINPTAETQDLVRSEYKRIGREYLFVSKRIKQVIFACLASNRIIGF
jgi:hypothetical protein